MKPIGKVRRSQVLSGNGPGAIINFRGENGAPISVVAAGLENWDMLSHKRGLMNDQTITLETLQERLQVKGFRLPPVGTEVIGKDKRERLLPSYRFPDWHVCPICNLLQPSRKWAQEYGKPELSCPTCKASSGGRKQKVYVVPARFIVTCPSGHLQDFPWSFWVKHETDCARKKPLKLVGDGAGLRGLRVKCTECLAEKNLDGALSPSSFDKLNIKCQGVSPWLSLEKCDCANKPVAIQRGASNAYFPVIASALDVPPFGGSFRDEIEDFWEDLKALDDRSQIPAYVRKRIHPYWPDPEASVDDLISKILTLLNMLDNTSMDLRLNEHFMLRDGKPSGENFSEFETTSHSVPESLKGYFDRFVSVERLREVRALRGFTRLSPVEADDTTTDIAPLSRTKLNWLPAIEVHGEGIFLNLDETNLLKWESRQDVRDRALTAHHAAEKTWREHNGEDKPFPMLITARFLLIHTLAHAVAEQLSLDSGYSTASIRERLYVSEGPNGMCGFLLYTSAPDSDGTLGGLSRKGRPAELGALCIDALLGLEWCSSDPLCGTGILSLSEGAGSAACHSCVFVPETSCEHFNRHLDRAMLVGTEDNPDIGFFRPLLKDQS